MSNEDLRHCRRQQRSVIVCYFLAKKLFSTFSCSPVLHAVTFRVHMHTRRTSITPKIEQKNASGNDGATKKKLFETKFLSILHGKSVSAKKKRKKKNQKDYFPVATKRREREREERKTSKLYFIRPRPRAAVYWNWLHLVVRRAFLFCFAFFSPHSVHLLLWAPADSKQKTYRTAVCACCSRFIIYSHDQQTTHDVLLQSRSATVARHQARTKQPTDCAEHQEYAK